MVTVTIDEAYAFDMLSILQVKLNESIDENKRKSIEENYRILSKDLQKQIKELKNENAILKKSVAQDDIDLEIDNKYEDGELIKVKFNASALYDTRCEKLKKHVDRIMQL